MSYVGGPGFELYVPTEMARHVYLALQAAGRRPRPRRRRLLRARRPADRGRPARLGRGARSGRDAVRGGHAVRGQARQADGFIGRERPARAPGRSRRPSAWCRWSSIRPTPGPGAARRCSCDGEPAGEITSAGWSPKLGACVALGYLRGAAAAERHAGTRGRGRRLGRARRRHGLGRGRADAARDRRVSDTRGVLAALDRRAGVRAVAAVRPRRRRDPAGRRPERARPRRLGRPGRARRHPDRHRLAGLQPAGIAHHHPLRRALGDRRRRRLVRAGDGDLHVRAALWPPSRSACS